MTIPGLIRIVSTTLTAIVVVGFVAFASSELGEASDQQVTQLRDYGAEVSDPDAIDEPAPPLAVERARERAHSSGRELLDDANDVLLSPFTGVSDSNDVWVVRGLPAVLAFLVYGFGLRLLANALPKPKLREPEGFGPAPTA